MLDAPLRFARVMHKGAWIGAIGFSAVLASIACATAAAGVAASHHLERGVVSGTIAVPPAELKRHRARGAKARSTRAARIGRARAARINRLLRGYRAARKARARIPLGRRLAYARGELARAERRGAKYCLATAIYHEARSETARGQRAVAEVILARTRVAGRPKSVCGVVYEGAWRTTGCQFSFTCDNRSDGARSGTGWALANQIAASALASRAKPKRVARGATFYHARYVRPGWSRRMIRVARIGAHIFYRPRRGRSL